MPDLEVTIFNTKFKLSYQENEKKRLINAVNKLNESWNKYSNLHGKVSDFKIATLISLELQDSLDNKNNEITKIENLLDDISDELTQIKTNLLKKNA